MTNDKSHIAQLLDRYFAGESTLEEEQVLRDYFQQDDIPAEWASYRDLFCYFQTAATLQSARDFEQQLQPKRIRPLRSWLAYAAAIALLVASVGLYFWPTADAAVATTSTINWEQYEPATKEEAAQVLHRALKHTANTMHRGFELTAQEVRVVQTIIEPLK